MSGLSLLILFGVLTGINYYFINHFLSDTFKENRLNMAVTSCLSAFAFMVISIGFLMTWESSNPQEVSYKSSGETKVEKPFVKNDKPEENIIVLTLPDLLEIKCLVY